MTQPLVSIVIPTYNRAHLIQDAIESCLSQTYLNTEIIVVDDGSTDDTRQLLQAQYDERIHLIQQRNQGPAIARNTGVEAAQGEYIQFCDTDDLLHPTKIERCLPYIVNQPDIGLVYTRFRFVDRDGKTPLSLPPSSLLPDNSFCDLISSNGAPIQTSTTLFRKSAFLTVSGFRADEDQRCAEDWDLLLRLATQYRMVGVDEILVDYRKHPEGITASDPLMMAQGRLQTVQYARHYDGREKCLSDVEYDEFEADRYHVLALVQWEQGNHQAARESLHHALRLAPRKGKMRRFYTWLSYLFPASSTRWVNSLVKQLR